jgi:hypothetical protein
MTMTTKTTTPTTYATARSRTTRPVISIRGAQRSTRPVHPGISFSWSGLTPRR